MRLSYGTYIGDGAVLDAEIAAVEHAGFDSMCFSEHHGMKGYVPDPLAAATYVLGRAPSLRAGPVPMVLPLHEPVAVAEAAALADCVSGGRLRFGVAAGYLERDFEQRRLDVADRVALLEEGTAIVRSVWTGTGLPFVGKHFQVPALDGLAQPPSQPGGPPIWMACGTPAGVRRAARLADGVVIDSVRSDEAVTFLIDGYRAACRALGKDIGEVVVMRRGWIGTPAETDRFVDTLGAELARFAQVASGQSMPWFSSDGDDRSAEAVRRRALVGSADDALAGLDRLTALGVDHVILKVQWTGGADAEVLLQQLGRWAEVCAAVNR